ncbi:MAG TPA: GGDEF domain-containing protein [Gaiellaceae bacterium]|nr:GGDEF domain-containing protein [Gaiellaceae bacterium]
MRSSEIVLIVALCGAVAVAGAAVIAAARARDQLGKARELADLDSLTGLLNQRSFHELLGHEVARAHRYKRRLALIVVDVDNFKSINDQIGHLEGDTVLNEVAARLRAVVRAADIACRIGGDEFGIILPESSGDDAQMLAERVVFGVSNPPLPDAPWLSVSAGVGELRDGDSPNDLFARADKNLYGAKGASTRVSRG